MRKTLTATAAIGLLALAGCSSNPAPEQPEAAETASEATEQESTEHAEERTEQETPEPEPGANRENPIPVGETFTIGDWEVTATGETYDATEAANNARRQEVDDYYGGDMDYYFPVEEGAAIVAMPVTLTYVGEGSDGTGALKFDYITASGHVYDSLLAESLPNEIDEELFNGASAEGEAYQKVAPEDIEGGVWRVETTFIGDDLPDVFVATEEN